MTTNILVQSLDVRELTSNKGLLLEVGPAMKRLYDSDDYQLLLKIMESEQRTRAMGLIDKVGTAEGVKAAAELRELFTFRQVVLQVANTYDALLAQEAEANAAGAEGFDAETDNVPG